MSTEQKRCTRCKLKLPRGRVSVNCRECLRRWQIIRRDRSGRRCSCGAAIPDGYKSEICPDCVRMKGDAYRRRKGRICTCAQDIPDDYRNSCCPLCQSERSKRWQKANRAYDAERSRQQRAHLLSVTVGVVDIEKVYADCDSRCQMCGKHTSGADRQIDHIIPLAKGGGHVQDNLQVLCGHCNRRKSDRMPEELE